MTSRRCFFKIMREDFRHKSWMLALSILGNLLAFPVTYLIMMSGEGYFRDMSEISEYAHHARRIIYFFGNTLNVTGGIIAIAGALIVGLFGFRYVFHRKMVDTYHSVPVKRRTLFAVGWLNGFLIWFIPFLCSLLFTVTLAEGQLASLRKDAFAVTLRVPGDDVILAGWPTGGSLVLNALQSAFGLLVAFLLVYHLVLLSVMLCGNVLNTLVTAAVFGAGAISAYGILYAFCEAYLNTFVVSLSTGAEKVVYGSPIGSAIYVLVLRAQEYLEPGTYGFVSFACWNLLIAIGMGALALAAYLKRASELAEQGVTHKPIRVLIQTITTLVAALCGWMLFFIFANSMFVWGIFGAILVGAVVFGILDIIFAMDFKAFFVHKIQMVITVIGSLLIGVFLYFDWIGYDCYLPEEEEIAEIGIYYGECSNVNFYAGEITEETNPLNTVHIRNAEAAYDFLEVAVEYERNRADRYGSDMLQAIPVETGGNAWGDEQITATIYAKVTLNNGRSYYRNYTINKKQAEVVYALVNTPEYMETNFKISDACRKSVSEVTLRQMGMRDELHMEKSGEIFQVLCEAYNRDVEENPEILIRGSGRLLSGIRYWGAQGTRWMEVFEGMTHTRKALRDLGYGEYAEPIPVEEIQQIKVTLGYVDAEQEDYIKQAADYFGVYPTGIRMDESEVEEVQREGTVAVETKDYFEAQEVYISITDIEEIQELLALCSNDWYRYRNGLFWDTKIPVTIEKKDGEMFEVYISRGAMPEKFILRFGEM